MTPLVLTSSRRQVDAFLSDLMLHLAVVVVIIATEGSAPRATGTWMAVFANRLVGTIGGGHLEMQALALAREMLLARAMLQERATLQAPAERQASEATAPVTRRFALGPALGQCCGGVVQLNFEFAAPADAPAWGARLQTPQVPVALFGGGHVGLALVHALTQLPFQVSWTDSRDGVFPDPAPAGVHCDHSDPVQAAVPGLQAQSRVLIMSFSHAEDLDVLAACLLRQRQCADLPYIGLIGSRTKWTTFRHRLLARGFTAEELAHVTCPIGVPGIVGKEPEVIAIAVAAQLLQTL